MRRITRLATGSEEFVRVVLIGGLEEVLACIVVDEVMVVESMIVVLLM